MVTTKKLGFNSYTVALLTILVIGIFFFSRGFQNILTWDVMGYNSYLPLIFTEHTFESNLEYFRIINERYGYSSTLYQYVDLPNGNVFIKYTIGWAILYTPFYLIGDLWAYMGGYLRDGFSRPYQIMALLGAFFYFCVSVFLIRKVLLLYFSDRLTMLVLFILCLGTNFFYVNFVQIGLTNNLMIPLVAFLILRTHAFHQNVTIWNGILLGITVGLMALTRTPSVVIALFAVIYGYKTYGKTIFSKVKFFLTNHLVIVLVTLAVAGITYLPQIIYWKLTSGNYILNSYANNPGEGMDWFRPYIWQTLFSFKNGWLLYTPMMIFALLGFYFWIKKDRSNGVAGLLTFLLFFYVVSSWTCWWYASNFSHRAMVDIYPLLAIAMGYFFLNVQKKWVYGLAILFMLLNFVQSYQGRKWIIDGSYMNAETYASIFLQTTPLTDYQRKLMEIDYISYSNKRFDINEFKLLHTDSLAFDSFVLSTENQYAPGMTLELSKIKDKNHLLVRSQWKYEGDPEGLKGKILNTNMYYKETAYGWSGRSLGDPLLIHDSINKTITYDYFAPYMRSKDDKTYVGLWAQSGDSIVITGLKVQVFEWDPLKRF